MKGQKGNGKKNKTQKNTSKPSQEFYFSTISRAVSPAAWYLPCCRNYENTLSNCCCRRKWVTFHSFAKCESGGPGAGFLTPSEQTLPHSSPHLRCEEHISLPDTNYILKPEAVISPPDLGTKVKNIPANTAGRLPSCLLSAHEEAGSKEVRIQVWGASLYPISGSAPSSVNRGSIFHIRGAVKIKCCI